MVILLSDTRSPKQVCETASRAGAAAAATAGEASSGRLAGREAEASTEEPVAMSPGLPLHQPVQDR